jgi:hypothetical protein
MIKTLASINEDMVTELVIFIRDKTKVDVNKVVTLSKIEQLGYMLMFLESKNIGILVDNSQAVLYWINPRLVVNNIIKIYNESGEISDRFDYIEFKETSIINAYINTIKYIFSKVLVPF